MTALPNYMALILGYGLRAIRYYNRVDDFGKPRVSKFCRSG